MHAQTATVKETQTDASFDSIYKSLQQGKSYDAAVKRGFITWNRKAANGIQLFALIFIPYDYTPQKKWPVRIYLNGNVSNLNPYNVMDFIDTTQAAYKEVEQIRIYPSGYYAARWYYDIQYRNVMQLLDSVKQLYNVDENYVSLGGVSDGGTGTYAFANYNVTPFSCFTPYIGCACAMKFLGSKQVYFNNFSNRPMFIVNGRLDQTFPYYLVIPYVSVIQKLNPNVVFIIIDTCGHTMSWLPQLRDSIDHFLQNHPRNPYPDHLVWETENSDKYNRCGWVVIRSIAETNAAVTDPDDVNVVMLNGSAQMAFSRDSLTAIIDVARSGNKVTVKTKNVKRYVLLLSPDQFDFSQPVTVITNDQLSFEGIVKKDIPTLLKWNTADRDRSMLFAAELVITPGKKFKK